MTNREFPPIPEHTKPLWVSTLNPSVRVGYDEARAHDIEKDTEGALELFRQFREFDGVPEDVLSYFALRYATMRRDDYEGGVQVGLDAERERTKIERTRQHSISMARQEAAG